MGIYKFRICERKDRQMLVDFIDKYWKKDHILVRSKEILDFQYYNREEDNYTFLLAENQETGEIDGIRGWIRVAQYDSALAPFDDVWSAVWKVRTDVQNNEIKLLGSYLGRYLNKHKGFGTVGISKFSYAMHTALRHVMCSLNQYYILNPDTRNYKIANIKTPVQAPKVGVTSSDFHLINIDDILQISDLEVPAYYRPFKSITYLYNRFQKHPVYKYYFHGVQSANGLECVLVSKFVEVNGSKVIRIVDVLGSLENVGNLYDEFVRLLRISNSEYVDFLCYGVGEEIFDRMGFKKLDTESGNIIIPNYFEPFLQQNIVINGAYKAADNYVMFKADADQDRPS